MSHGKTLKQKLQFDYKQSASVGNITLAKSNGLWGFSDPNRFFIQSCRSRSGRVSFRAGAVARAVHTVTVPSSPTRGGCLTAESPVRYRRHGDAALERGAVGEKQEGGEESSVGLEVKQHGRFISPAEIELLIGHSARYSSCVTFPYTPTRLPSM